VLGARGGLEAMNTNGLHPRYTNGLCAQGLEQNSTVLHLSSINNVTH